MDAMFTLFFESDETLRKLVNEFFSKNKIPKDKDSNIDLNSIREKIYEIYEEVCGARLTTNMGRIGGFERNFNDIAFQKLEKSFPTEKLVDQLPSVPDIRLIFG